MTPNFPHFVGAELAAELTAAFERIGHCCSQLDDTQIWWRPRDDMNSIANLMLHLTGNIRQLIHSSIGGAPDIRQRQAEFDAEKSATKSQILEDLRAAVLHSCEVLQRQSESDWQQPRTFAGKGTSALGIAVKSVAHFRGHTQEIIHLTRLILAERYQFAGPPPGPKS